MKAIIALLLLCGACFAGEKELSVPRPELLWQYDYSTTTLTQAQAVAYCESQGMRLPTRVELESLIDYDRWNPSSDANVPIWWLWTSTVTPWSPTAVWFGEFSVGVAHHWETSRITAYAKCVTGDDPKLRCTYRDNGNGTVTDTTTRLMWQKTSDPRIMTYSQAATYCALLGLANYHDWRLPTIDELFRTTDDTRGAPSTVPALTALSGGYWSSTRYVRDDQEQFLLYPQHWIVTNSGCTGSNLDEEMSYYSTMHVRCVRIAELPFPAEHDRRECKEIK